MLKGLLTLLLPVVIAMSPAGGVLPGNGAAADPTGAAYGAIDCARLVHGECHGSDACPHLGHVGCDHNPMQIVATDVAIVGPLACYAGRDGSARLPPNETHPPRRPPRRC